MDLKSILFNLVIVYLLYKAFSYVTVKFTQNISIEQIISELNKNNFKMVGSTGCSFCHRQLKLLNLDWDTNKLTIINCANNPEICSSTYSNITAFPSWINNRGNVYSGFKTILQLKKMIEEN